MRWQDWSVWSQAKDWPFLSSCSKARLLSIISYTHTYAHTHTLQPQTPAVTTTANKQSGYKPIQPNQAVWTKYSHPHSMHSVCQEPRMAVPTWQTKKWELITSLLRSPIYSSWLQFEITQVREWKLFDSHFVITGWGMSESQGPSFSLGFHCF